MTFFHEDELKKFRRVGIIGIPPRSVIRRLNENGAVIHDLDEPIIAADIETASPYLPRVYCAVLRTAMVNALLLDLEAVIIDTGPGKCDSALHTATIMEDALAVPVIKTRNLDTEGVGYPVSLSALPLLEKLRTITAGVKFAEPPRCQPEPSPPTAGFWGVPPRDFSILSLFPDTTQVYGWTRCMENKTPADHDLEASCNLEVPTVFFAQSFCAKTALARYLAKKHPRGLYLDVDVHTGSSAKAKIQAFLELSGGVR